MRSRKSNKKKQGKRYFSNRNSENVFSGSFVAIVTPFKDGKIDKSSYKRLIKFHLENETDGLVPCGTTGESATLTYDEHEMMIDLTIQEAKGKIPVIAGTGSNSTHETVKLTKYAQKAGADAVLLICPYYNKPTQRGLYLHFKAVAEECSIPIVLYNIPSRTGINMVPETIAKLFRECSNIVAVKEASGSLDQMTQILKMTNNKICVLSGDDALTLPLLSIGGRGVISVVANIVPLQTHKLVEYFLDGEIELARQIHYYLYDLIKAMFIQTNPIPVKSALKLMGRIKSEELRLPMCSMEKEKIDILKKVLKGYKLIR